MTEDAELLRQYAQSGSETAFGTRLPAGAEAFPTFVRSARKMPAKGQLLNTKARNTLAPWGHIARLEWD